MTLGYVDRGWPATVRQLVASAANRRWLAALLVGLCLWAMLGSGVAAAVAEHDQQFVTGLRQRRLYSLAEAFCLDRLGSQETPADDMAQWAVELIRVYSDQAVNTRGPARAAAWQKAAETATRFETKHPADARLPLVHVQAALALLAYGELSRMEAEVGTQPDQALASARATIRDAARKLESIDEHLTDAIPLAERNARDAAALSSAELSSLQQNVRYQWARALRNQALCYPSGSPDRVAALTQAVRMLDQPLRVLPADDPLVARIKVDQSVCQRLLGELRIAEAALQGLDSEGQAAAIRLPARAELLRLRLAAGNVDEALQLLGQGRTIDGVASPELDFAFLEVYIAKWRAAGKANSGNASSEWEKKSIAALEFIEQSYGPYWARRAEMLLVSVNLRAGSGNVSILDRAARDLYRKGRLDEAVVAYDKAADAARSDGDTQQAFELAYRGALILQQRQMHQQARERFCQLARSDQTHPLASNAHLLGIVNAAQEARADASLLTNYATLLNEHLRAWPTAETADTVRLWLGQLHESRQQWAAATAAFAAITPASEHFPVAVTSSLRCWSTWLEAMQVAAAPVPESGDSGEPAGVSMQQTAEAAIQYGTSVLHRHDGNLPTQWNALDGECLVGLARIQLRFALSDAARLEALLRVAIENAEEPAPWRNAAQSLLILAVLRRPGGQQESQQLLAKIGGASTEQLLELLAGIEQAAADAPQLAAAVGTLERDLADRLLNAVPPLAADQRLRVAMIRAGALVKLADDDAAVLAYADLAQQHPNQASVLIAYAERLLASDSRERLQLALSQWRRIASKSRPRTPRWFRAKYSVALAQFKLGDQGAAAKLIRYLQATEDLASSGMEHEFRELLQKCQ